MQYNIAFQYKYKITIIFLILSSFVYAQAAGGDELTNALCSVYETINGIIPILSFLLFVMAGIAYAAGQFFGAEIRAKSQAWAMNMIAGAIIGFLIIVFSDIIIFNLTGFHASDLC